MIQENITGTPSRKLSVNDISGVELTTQAVRPETGLTEESKSQRRLSIKDIGTGDPSSVTFPGNVKKYEKVLGEGQYHPELDPTYISQLMHERQTATSVIGATVARFGIEVAATALQTLAYDSDLTLGTDLAEKTQQDFGNGLSRFSESMQEFGRERLPIYVDPYKVGKFDPGSLSWWGENAISVGSSIGMVAPAMLLAAATGGVAGAIGLGELAASTAFKGITTALWSRHAENLMEASGVYKQAFNEAKQKNMSDYDAKNLASLAASNTYKKQWVLLAQDIPQYILLNKLGAFAKGGAAAEKQAIQELSSPVQKYLGYGTLNTSLKRTGAVAKDMAGEAGEEIYQFLVNEQSNLMARNAADPNHNVKHSMIDVVKANYDNGDMWTAGFWGAAGAGVMQATMHGINYKLQESVNKAQLETVTSIGPTLKQSFTEYDEALKDNDPLFAERALPSFIVSLGMKLKKTNTTVAFKDMMKQLRDAPEGTAFEQYGVDAATQGRLKKDPAFYEQVEKGIDRVGELYDRYLKENQANKNIAEKDKEPKAQVMANTKFLLDSTITHAKKLETAIETAWSKIEEVDNLSIPGQQAEMAKQKRISLQRTIDSFKKRQLETTETATPEEKKQIEAIIAKAELEMSIIDNQIDDLIGNKENGKKGTRTAKEAKADKKIVLPQDQVDEFIKQSGRLNAANASITQLTEMMEELRSSTPLSETIENQIKNEFGDNKPDSIDKDNNILLGSKVEYVDETTETPIVGTIVGVQEADENDENDITTYAIEKEDGEIVTKPDTELTKLGDPVSGDEAYSFDSLSETDEDLLGRPAQVEDEEEEKVAMLNMNKLSYSQWNDVIKQHVNRNAELAKVLSDKNTSFEGSQAFYRIDRNDLSTKKMIESLISTGIYIKEEVKGDGYVKTILKIIVNDKQRGILKKFNNGNKLTKAEIVALIDEGTDDSYTSFVDGFLINIKLNLDSTWYYGGLTLHSSKFVPNSSIPVKIKIKGATVADRKESISKYKKDQYKRNRQIRRDMLSILLSGGEIHTSGLDRSKGSPASASKAIASSERNKNLEVALGINADAIKLAITKSNIVTPELTTAYLDKNSPVTETIRSMQGKGSIYAILAGEGLNGETGVVKLNKGSFDEGLAGLILDAFFLVGQAKILPRGPKSGPIHSHQIKFSKPVLERNGVKKLTGLSAGELIDLFVVNDEQLTEPLNPRFKARFGKDPILAKVMADKRLYLHIKGKTVILLYGNDENNKPYTIDLNQRGIPGDVSDLSRNREHFIQWLIENKRFATLLYKEFRYGTLNLNGDFLDDRVINIEFKNKKYASFHREKGQTYSSFLIKNNMVVTDVSRDENGSLFRDPVVNLNLVNNRGGLNIISKTKPLPKTEVPPVADNVITSDDLKDKKDASFSATKQEQEEKKPSVKKKETPYKNRFVDKKDRELYDIETYKLVNNPEIIDRLSNNIEGNLFDPLTGKSRNVSIDELMNSSVDILNEVGVEFGKGSKKNQNILGYLKDRLEGKTNRTLKEEFDAATTPGTDKTSATSTEATGTPIETTVNNIEVEIDTNDIYPLLGDKTVSGNVVIKPVYQKEGVAYAKSIGGVFSLRVNDSDKHFGNPYSSIEKEIAKGLIATNSTKESVNKYINWVITSTDPRAIWIREQLKSGKLKGKPIIYYKELGEPSHATALDYLINKYNWNKLGRLGEEKTPSLSMEELTKLANNDEFDEIPFARPETTTVYEGYSKEIRQKEINWAFDVVGIAKEEWALKNRITDLIYKGKRNFALYSHSAILLYDAAEIGTVYHEAFHRVSLGYLTPDERKRFYRAARLAYNIDKEATDKQVEEILAEKFRSFILADNKQQTPGLIQKFFDWIVKGIKALFYGERRLSESEINQLFKQIRNGKYRKSSTLEVNKDSLGDDLYARAVIKGVEFDTLNTRKDFKTITNSLANTLMKLSKVEDLNDVGNIDYALLIPHLERLRDGFKANSEYEGNSKEVRDRATHLYEMYDEILGEKIYELSETERGVSEEEIDKPYRYDTFASIIRPAIDNFFLSIGIKQVGISEDDFVSVDTEDIESIGRLGGDYLMASFERNKKDTALPAIKFMIATLNEDSELIEDVESGALRRVPKVNQVTMLYEPVDFKKVWSKAFHALHHLDSIEEMISELRYISERDNYSPFAELADKLDKESENVRQQFYRTLSCAEHDFINLSFTRSSRGFNLRLNRSAEQSAINDNIRAWSNAFFNNPEIIRSAEEYSIKRDREGNVLFDKDGDPIADTKGKKIYVKKYHQSFFEKEKEKYLELSQDIGDATKNKSKNYEGKLVKFIPRVQEFLSDFGINIDAATIRRVISNIEGETINNDMDRLNNWIESDLSTLFSSKAAESAENNNRVDKKTQSLFKIGFIRDIARADIELHPEKKADMQVGPGNGDTSRKHTYNTHAADCHATRVATWIQNKEGYVEERLTNLWTRRSRILRMMVPYDLANEQEVAAAAEMKKNFKLVTYSYLKEAGGEDKGRGYLNMTEKEDYLIRFHLMMVEGLLPFPIMAGRKTYFLMDGVPRFKNAITSYNNKTKSFGFSKEIIDYFWDAYVDENERVAEAVRLVEAFKKAKGEEKEDLRKQLIVNYHFTGQYNVGSAEEYVGNATKLIRFRGFTVTDVFDDKTKEVFVKKLTTVVNKRITQELKYADSLGIISFDSETNGYVPGLINQSSIATYESEKEDDTDYGVRATIGEYTLNYMMAMIESERIFMGDPALFIKNRHSGEVVEELYKRYYGLGSTGDPYAESLKDDPDITYNASTIRTQEFESLYYKSLLDLHTKLWQQYYDEKDKENPDNLNNKELKDKRISPEDLAKGNLKGYQSVDSTDGGAIISPTMFKKMLKRSGAFPPKIQYAFELLMSTKVLSKEEEIKALGIVLNPQKTVYFGQHSENGIDRTVYDKMAMSVLFPRLVKGTHLEEVLDRMEKTGKYSNTVNDPNLRAINKKLKVIHVLNYDTSVKIGATTSHDLYKNNNARDVLADLTTLNIEDRFWRNLRQQQTTDPHEVVNKQMVGTQVFKIASSNIITNKPYGDFESGRDLLNGLTKSRIAISNVGRDHIESALGIQSGIISNSSLLSMLRLDARKARKSDDFRSALRLDSDGNMYLELDAFPDRNWVYSRLMNLVKSNTIDLKLPGSQLIQASDYGYSSKGLPTIEKEFKSELKFYEVNSEGTKLVNMECRVPIRAFKKLIPNYEKLTHEERVKVLPVNMQIIGYRIPTQGQNSVVNLTVVDYLPDQAGEVIHLPLEFTTLTGSDFDIDKLFTMMKNYKLVNGKLQEVRFSDQNTKEAVEARYENKLRELYKIYRRDHTIFDEKTSEVLKDAKEEALNDVKISSAQDNIIRKNIVESIKDNKRALENATDEISKQYLEEIIFSEQRELDEINDKNFAESFSEERWVKQKPIVLKALLKANKIDTLETFGELPIEEQNTSSANENRIFEIFQTVISDLKHARNTTLPLGTLTKELKEKRRKYIDARSGGRVIPLEALESETPAYQSAIKFKFMTSAKGIGVYALQNSNHALTQQANIKLRTRFMYDKKLNKNGVVPLDLIEGRDLKYITDWLSAMLDAHVDAQKDNYIAELNVNSATYSVTSLLLRLGFGVSTFDILAQPAIVDLARVYYNIGGGRHVISDDAEYENLPTIERAYKRVKRQILGSLNRPVEEDSDLNIDLVTEDLYIPFNELLKDESLLLDGLNPTKNTTQEYKIRQLNFLECFMRISRDAEKVNSLVLNTRVDTGSFGSNPVEFKHFMNRLVSLEELDKPKDKRSFINLDRLLNSEGKYVENGTMLSPLLNNSIFYLNKIFNNKSIIGSVGFDRMFWGLANSMPNNENFRLSVINSMTGDLFSTIVSRFFSDPRFKIGMTEKRLHDLFIHNEKSVFATLSEVMSPKFKYYNELKENKILEMLQTDSKPLSSIDNFITAQFRSLSDSWDTDDYISDFQALVEHEDSTVQKLARQLYLYAFYSTGFKHRYYDFLGYIPTAINKEINILSSVTKRLEPVSFNKFIRQMLTELNDPSTIVEFYTGVKKDFFENFWYNWRYVPKVDETNYSISADGDGFIDYVAIPFGRKSKYALGTNEDGDIVYPSYVTLTGGSHISQYDVPRSGRELNDLSEMEVTSAEESDIIGGNTALFKLVGVAEAVNEEGEEIEDVSIYVPINKKGAMSHGIVINELGIDSETSFIKYNNLIKQKPLKERIQVVKDNVMGFKEIPFEKQQVNVKMVRTVLQEEDAEYGAEMEALKEQALRDNTVAKLPKTVEKSGDVTDATVKEQFVKKPIDEEKGKEINDICNT